MATTNGFDKYVVRIPAVTRAVLVCSCAITIIHSSGESIFIRMVELCHKIISGTPIQRGSM